MHGCSAGVGGCVVDQGHAWLLRGVCMVAQGGVCVVAPGGHAWLLQGVCMVAPGGVRGCSRGGMCGCSGGACVVALGGHAWLLWGACVVALGGMHGCSGGACMVAPGGGMRGIRRDTEIRSMSGRYASYWNAFLLKILLPSTCYSTSINCS